MSKYGESFLTKPRLYTSDEWADTSRMQFGETTTPGVYKLSLLGMINGCPILSTRWRLAVKIEKDQTITGWTIIRAKQ